MVNYEGFRCGYIASQRCNMKQHLKNRIRAMEYNLEVAKKNRQFSLIKELTREITKVKKVLKESA